MGLYWGACNLQLLFGPMPHSEPLPISLNPFFSEPIVRVFIYTHGAYGHCCQVLVVSHEVTMEVEMSSYFGNKFYPARPVYLLGCSYKANPTCKPEETLFDDWMDRSHSQACVYSVSCLHHAIFSIMFAAWSAGSNVRAYRLTGRMLFHMAAVVG